MATMTTPGISATTAGDALSLTLHGGDLVVRNVADGAEVARISAAGGVTVTGSFQGAGLGTSGAATVGGNLDLGGNLTHNGARVGFFGKDPGATQRPAITKPAATAAALASYGFTQVQADALVTAVRSIIDALGFTSGFGLTA
jgi:hypothetical protein